MFSTAPFVPQFGTGAPPGTVPRNQLYFDKTATPYTGYVWDPIAGVFKSFGDNPAAIGLPVTPGSVLFGSASGVIGQDNARFFWDDTNFRLGIGTITPQSVIDCWFNTITGTPPGTPSAQGIRFAGTNVQFVIEMQGVNGGSFLGRKTTGTFATPTAQTLGSTIVGLTCRSYNGTAYSNNSGQLQFIGGELWNAAAEGTDLRLQLIKNGTIALATAQTWFNDGRYQSSGAVCDLSYSYQTPAAGFAILIGDTVGRLLLNPAGALATGTITLPANPKDGQICKIKSSLAVAALTLNPSAGQTIADPLTALVAGQMYEFTYVASVAIWL